MVARVSTVLLALAAVFALHGVQCGNAADRAGHAADHAVETYPLAMTEFTPGHAHGNATAGPTLPDRIGGDADSGPVAPAVAAAGHGGAPQNAPAHLWTVCLAVLAAAIAVLLVLLAPRVVHRTAPVMRCARASFGSLAPLRPPDLSALCLLRI
ncbi:MAG: hypothetical protein JWQ99_1914 [Blastococcus sp.]|jgi:hypothetical protein|nr:hypothetical protein [Blastococcus sp.]